MYMRFGYLFKSLLHRSEIWLLGAYDVRSSVSCHARHWISRTDPKKTCRVRFNLQVMVPIVFGEHSDFGRHALNVISSTECPSLCMTFLVQNVSPSRILIITNAVHSSENSHCLGRLYSFGSHHRFGIHNQSHHISATPSTPKRSHRSRIHPSEEDQSIRWQSSSMTRSPTHAKPFSDSGACNSGTSQLFHNQKMSYIKDQTVTSTSSDYKPLSHFLADPHVSSLIDWLLNPTCGPHPAATDQQHFFSNQISATRFNLMCLNISQQHQLVYPNQNKSLKFQTPCLHQEGACEAPYSVLIVGDFWSDIMETSVDLASV
jgi:hypothetical protein